MTANGELGVATVGRWALALYGRNQVPVAYHSFHFKIVVQFIGICGFKIVVHCRIRGVFVTIFRFRSLLLIV